MNSYKKYIHIIKYVFSKNKQGAIILILFNLFSAILEYFTLALLIPFIGLISQNNQQASKISIFLSKYIAEDFSSNKYIIQFSFLFIFFILISLTIRILSLRYTNKYTVNVGSILSDDIFKTIIHQPYEYNIKNNSNYSIATINIKSGLVIYGIIQPIFNLLTSLLLISAIFISLLVASWRVVIVLTFFFSLFYIGFNKLFSKQMKLNAKNISTSSGESLKILNEVFSGLRYVILNNSFPFFAHKYSETNKSYLRSQGSNMQISNLPKLILEGLIMVGVIVFMMIYFSNLSESIEIGKIVLFVIAGQRLLPIIQQSFFYYNSIKGNGEALNDVLNILILGNKNKQLLNETEEITFNKQIEFSNVDFFYDKNIVLQNISFKIKIGTKIGLVGESGSGKSTLVDLILGLLEPKAGKILIDDTILSSSNLFFWRKCIASVPQSIVLNDQTVYENIAFGIPYNQIDFQLVHESAQKANIYNDILALQNGFDTKTGDKGLSLSGGQRQRIGIARALYLNPKLLILDEATSALDSDNEMSIMNTIYDLKGITVIIISHRKHTLERADMILEIKNKQLISTL
jgi:ATP-binding cassette, subfamily B, bacterial PglK